MPVVDVERKCSVESICIQILSFDYHYELFTPAFGWTGGDEEIMSGDKRRDLPLYLFGEKLDAAGNDHIVEPALPLKMTFVKKQQITMRCYQQLKNKIVLIKDWLIISWMALKKIVLS